VKKFVGIAVAAVLLVFAWRGSELNVQWPPVPVSDIKVPKPEPELMQLAADVGKILPKMTPADRRYLAHFYDAMAFVLLRDGEREKPIIADTERFAAFHGGSLRLAIDKSDVGKYDGLGEAIDMAFIKANGADVLKVDEKVRRNLVVACGVLSWTFSIHGE
jgi:hypothetical protein